MRYTVTATPQGNVVRVFGAEHTGHPDAGKPPRHVAKWCHELIRATYYEREGVTVAEVVDAVRQEAITRAIKRQKTNTSRAKMEEIFLTEGCTVPGVRDYLIKDEQVAHIVKQLNADTCQLLPEEAESIAKWVQQHPTDTLMHRPGVDTPPESTLRARSTHAAHLSALSTQHPPRCWLVSRARALQRQRGPVLRAPGQCSTCQANGWKALQDRGTHVAHLLLP